MNTQDVINIIQYIQRIYPNYVVEIIPEPTVMNNEIGFFYKINQPIFSPNQWEQLLRVDQIPYSFQNQHRQDINLVLVVRNP